MSTAEELVSFAEAHLPQSTRQEVTLSPTKQFLARMLGYKVTGHTRETVSWDSVCMAVLLILCSLLAIGFDVGLLNTVGGFGKFMTSSGIVGSNILRGTSVWIHHEASYVYKQIGNLGADAEVFHDNLNKWTATLTVVVAAEESSGRRQPRELSALEAAGEKGEKNISAWAEGEKNIPVLAAAADKGKHLYTNLRHVSSHWIHVTPHMTQHEIKAQFENAKPLLLVLNLTLTAVRGYTRKFVESLVPLREHFQVKVADFMDMYAKQMKAWMKVLGLQAELRGKQEISPALTFVHNVSDRLNYALQEFESFTTSFKKTVRMEHVGDDRCFLQFESALNNLVGNSTDQFRDNVAEGFQNNLNISWIFVGALGGIREKINVFQDFDNNVTEAVVSLQSMLDHYARLDIMEETKDRRLSTLAGWTAAAKAKLIRAVDRVDVAMKGVAQHLLQLSDSGADETLLGIIGHVNETFHLLERRADAMDDMATDVKAYPRSFYDYYASDIFSSAAIVNVLMVSVFCLLAGLGSLWLIHYFANANFEHRMEFIVERYPESLKGLCAFHPHVQELDMTSEAALVRPAERAWLRMKFVVEYQKFAIVVAAFFIIAVMGLVILIGWTTLDPIIMTLIVTVLGAVCRTTDAEILIQESTCNQSLASVSDMLAGASILPGGRSCSASDLLLCSGFFHPMGTMLLVEMTLKLLIVILLFMLAHSMPGVVYHCFTYASQDIVAKVVTEKSDGQDVEQMVLME
eukprot:TRINITY_DN16310_c0_g3_i1.p1 TRINITY_DN16310_c0_g3~~TRINITY_DN16310_c0_g3_i1.p1  ORF type:complete len:745 (+),score=114.73 TRINITY_DN16310_c0_g3_i1:208-2442(+)